MRYIDLMGGQKPHLLVQVTNNLGAETVVQYAPSTKFYVADKLAGHALAHPPSFPGARRRAGGKLRLCQPQPFRHSLRLPPRLLRRRGTRVSRIWPSRPVGHGRSSRRCPLPATSRNLYNEDPSSTVPPAWTKTWFHTGAFFGESVISKQLEQEYYAEGDSSDAIAGLTQAQLESMLLDDTVLPTTILLPDGTRIPYDLSGEEMREACRALRGSILRQEVYALDDTRRIRPSLQRLRAKLHHRGPPAAGPEPIWSIPRSSARDHRLPLRTKALQSRGQHSG